MPTPAKPSGAPLILLALLAVCLVAYFQYRNSAGSVPRPEVFAAGLTLEQAGAAASASGRPVFVFATADWCPPCKAMKAGPLRDPGVARAIAERTEPVYLDVDQSPAQAAEFRVRSIPTMLLVRDGQMIARAEGYLDAGELVAWMNEALADAAPADAAGVTPGG